MLTRYKHPAKRHWSNQLSSRGLVFSKEGHWQQCPIPIFVNTLKTVSSLMEYEKIDPSVSAKSVVSIVSNVSYTLWSQFFAAALRVNLVIAVVAKFRAYCYSVPDVGWPAVDQQSQSVILFFCFVSVFFFLTVSPAGPRPILTPFFLFLHFF